MYSLFLIVLLSLMSNYQITIPPIDVQGHRGCRGLMPENTVEGFLHAIDLGVTTLEMDLVISGDHKVVVSHEPYFHHKISTAPDGTEITKNSAKEHNIYKMSADEIQKYDVGLKVHPNFPEQKKIACVKPLLDEVIFICDQYTKNKKLQPVKYNAEIKRNSDYDGIYHPDAGTFAALVYDQVKNKNIISRTTIQSFDISSIQAVRKLDDTISIALLVDAKEDYKIKLKTLGFIPNVLSPHFSLVNAEMVKICHENGMKLIPWTVNEKALISKIIDTGVDGIISDYPDRVIEVIKEKSR